MALDSFFTEESERKTSIVDPEAWELALRQFESIAARLGPMLENLAGHPIKVIAGAETRALNKDVIEIAPPRVLTEPLSHVRSLCDRRDAGTNMQRCSACATEEKILSHAFHEVSHVRGNSFAKVEIGGGQKKTAYEIASGMSDEIAWLLNAVDDTRVESKIRINNDGIALVLDADWNSAAYEGITVPSQDEPIYWNQIDQDQQAILGVHFLGYKPGFMQFLDSYVQQTMDDEILLTHIENAQMHAKGVAECLSYTNLIHGRLKQLGFFTPIPDPPPMPSESEENDDSSDDASPGDGDSGADGGSESSSVESGNDGGNPEESKDDGNDEPPPPGGHRNNSEDEAQSEDGDASDSSDGDDPESVPELSGNEQSGDPSGVESDNGNSDGDNQEHSADGSENASGSQDSFESSSDGFGRQDSHSSKDDDNNASGITSGNEPEPQPVPQRELKPSIDPKAAGIECNAVEDHGDNELTREEQRALVKAVAQFEAAKLEDNDDSAGSGGGYALAVDDGPLPKATILGWKNNAWTVGNDDQSFARIALSGEITRAFMVLKPVFSENLRSRHQPNMKGGRLNTRVLGRRFEAEDERLFKQRLVKKKRSYAAVITIDLSGSTSGYILQEQKMAAYIQAEIFTRLKIKFEIWGNYGQSTALALFPAKTFDEPWSDLQKQKLDCLPSRGGNRDGDMVSYARRRLDTVRATDKFVFFYTDGAFDADKTMMKELELFRKTKAYNLIGVGFGTDSPSRFGLDTVQLDSYADLHKISELVTRLMQE